MNYLTLYNHHIPQRAIDSKTPILALREWQKKCPELFVKGFMNRRDLTTMHIIKLDSEHGTASVDSKPIDIDEDGLLIGAIAKLCAPPAHVNQGRARYHLLKKGSFLGKSADVVIEVEARRISSVTFFSTL